MEENEINVLLRGLKAEKAELETELLGLNLVISRFEKKLISYSNVQAFTLTEPKPEPESYQVSEPATLPTISPEFTGRLFEDEKFRDFPKNENIYKQFIYLLSKINRVARITEFFETYNSLVSNNKKISKNQARATLHKLKADGTFVSVQYNNANQYQFYGFPDWVKIQEDGTEEGVKDIKEEFGPSAKDVPPTGFRNIEFI